MAADGHFIIAYTKVVTSGNTSLDGVFFQIFSSNGARTLGETAAPSGSTPGTPDDFAPDVAVSNSNGQFIIVWEQQNSPTITLIYTRAFQADGTPLIANDLGVSTINGEAFHPHVAMRPSTTANPAGSLLPVISYTFNAGNGVQQVYFRRYGSSLTALDIGPVGIPVSGTGTTAVEDQSALAQDASGNIFIAWTSILSGSPSQVLFQEFNANGGAAFGVPQFVDNNTAVAQTAPTIALNSDGRFLIAYAGSDTTSSSPSQIFFREFSPVDQPVGASRLFSSDANPADSAPRLASSGNNLFLLAADDLTGANPQSVVRGFSYVTSHIAVVTAASGGLAEFVLDSNGNNRFDTADSVFTFGFFTDTLVTGDWNGGGFDKVGVVRPYGAAAIWSLDTNGDGKFDTGDQVFVFGRAADQFLIGDWNGGGTAEIGVVRPFGATAIFSLDTNGDGKFDSGDAVYTFGLASDTFLVGDWNGSGTAKIGVVRVNANGKLVWSLDTNGNGTFDAGDTVTVFGQSSDLPIVGDWTGSGKSRIGVVRTNFLNGTATVIEDTNGDGVMDAGDATFTFGAATDKFIVGKWKPTAQPQFAAFPGPGDAAPLTGAQLAATVQQAIDDWAVAGLNAAQINAMENVHFNLAQLDGNLIGLTEGNTIDISDNADGWGWNTSAANPPSNRMDLLTTVSHELGHVVGLSDSSNLKDVMGDVLTPGTRHLPTTQDVDTLNAPIP